MADPINPKGVYEALLELILRQHPGLTAGGSSRSPVGYDVDVPPER